VAVLVICALGRCRRRMGRRLAAAIVTFIPRLPEHFQGVRSVVLAESPTGPLALPQLSSVKHRLYALDEIHQLQLPVQIGFAVQLPAPFLPLRSQHFDGIVLFRRFRSEMQATWRR
jgi:hypothetical protein